MGKPPMETDKIPHDIESKKEYVPVEQQAIPQPRSREIATSRKNKQSDTQGLAFARMKADKENVPRKAAYISVRNHKRCSIAAEVYHIPRGQIVDYVLDGWWAQCHEEIKSLYYRDRDVFEDD